MTVAVKDMDLSGFVPEYNGIRFGGSGTGILPGEVKLQGTYVYDDAGRAVTYIRYVLEVHNFVAGMTVTGLSAEAAHNDRVDRINTALMVPGKQLKLIGCALGWLQNPKDVMWGPKPLGIQWSQQGDNLAAELIWTCEFHVACRTPNASGDNNWLAWNYDTVWTIDDEGLTTRTITGYIQIPGVRIAGPGGVGAALTADAVRDRMGVRVPIGFKRLGQTFHESASKDRLDFSFVDVQLPAEALPAGITRGSGQFSISSNGIGFSKHTATLSMGLTSAPNVPSQTAGLVFWGAVIAKHVAMAQRFGSAAKAIPCAYSISHGLWTRETQGSFAWAISTSFNKAVNGAGIWEVVGGNYNTWRASMDALWGVRGMAGLGSFPGEDVIIDLCAAGSQGQTIGGSITGPGTWSLDTQFVFDCGAIPEAVSWLGHDLRIRVKRYAPQTVHRKAVKYTPQSTDVSNPANATSLAAAYFEDMQGQKPVTEYHGKPVTYIYLQFKGLKIGKVPQVPIIKSIAGLPVEEVEGAGEIEPARPVFDFLGCCAHFVRGVRVYRVKGYIPEIKEQSSPLICDGKSLQSLNP